MVPFRKGRHGFGRKVPTIDFNTEDDRDRAIRLLNLIETMCREVDDQGYALRRLGLTGLTVAVFDPEHVRRQ